MRYFLIVLLTGLVVRLPLWHTPFWRTSDVAEYVNVARNLSQNRGFLLEIKHNYFTDSPVITSAFTSRPVGTAILYSFLLKVNPDPYFLQLIILIIGALSGGVFYLLLRRFVWPKTALVFGLIGTLNPNFLITNRLIVSEIIFNFLVIGWSLIFYRFQNSIVKFVMLGFLAGLTYLVRQEGIFLVLIILFFVRSGILPFLISFLAITFPYFLANWQINASPFYNYNFWHFEVHEFQEGVEAGYGRTFPTPLQFVQNNFFWTTNAVVSTFITHLTSLFDKGFLGIMGTLLFFSVKYWSRKIFPLLIFVGLTLVLYGLMWSAMFERARHFILAYLILLIPIAVFSEKVKLRWQRMVVWSILIGSIGLYVLLDLHRIEWSKNRDPKIDTWSYLAAPQLYDWIKKNTKSTDIISSSDPMLVNLFSGRPTIITPKTIFQDKPIEEYVKKYHVSYFITNVPDQIEFLAKHEAFVTKAGEFWIFKTAN